MKTRTMSWTTNGSGAATVTGKSVPGGALVEAVTYIPGDTATGATVTVTDEFAGASFTIWVQATAGTSTIREFPRTLEQLNTDGSDLATHTRPVIAGVPKVVIASGGDTKSGSLILHLSEE